MQSFVRRSTTVNTLTRRRVAFALVSEPDDAHGRRLAGEAEKAIYRWGVWLPGVPLFGVPVVLPGAVPCVLGVVPGAAEVPPGCVLDGAVLPDWVLFSGTIPGGHGATSVVPLFGALVF